MNLPDTYRFSIPYISKLICLMLCVSLSSTNTFGQSVADQASSNGWSITPNHLAVNCADPVALTSLPHPQVKDISGQNAGLSAEDQYFSLASASKEWTNYFAVSRWEKLKIKGDGGVDVTGAPNAILVEGANSALVKVDAENMVQFRIVIPADGFIALDYENFGGSNLLFSVETGATVKEQKAVKAKIYTPALRRGDVLTLRFNNTAAAEPMQLRLNNLRFFTNAAGVWERKWTATSNAGKTTVFAQLVTVEKISIADVLFPEDVAFENQQPSGPAPCIDPACTGYPFADKDGDIETTADRMMIDRNNCSFEISWSDEHITAVDGCVVKRHWSINDPVSGNTFTAVQSIHLPNCPQQEKTTRQAPQMPEVARHGNPENRTLQALAQQDNF